MTPRFLKLAIGAVVLAAAALLAAPAAQAAPAKDAQSFVEALVKTGLQTLADKSLTPQAREARFQAILAEDFDLARVSRFVLGRGGRTASPKDLAAFEVLFPKYIVHSYADRFSDYAGESIKVIHARPESPTSTVVESVVLHTDGTPGAKVDWQVHQNGNDFRIVDVEVEGVSMALTLREEFSSVLERDGAGVAGLNAALQAKISGPTQASASNGK